MIFRKEPSPEGEYIDIAGQRYTLQYCRYIRSTEGINIGWTTFPDLDACLQAWGLKRCTPDMPLHEGRQEA